MNLSGWVLPALPSQLLRTGGFGRGDLGHSFAGFGLKCPPWVLPAFYVDYLEGAELVVCRLARSPKVPPLH